MTRLAVENRVRYAGYKAVIFDLDGTLMDTSPGVIKCMRQTLAQLGMPDEDEETIRKFIGPPAGEYFADQYGFTVEEAREASLAFREIFEKGPFLEALPYVGMAALLERLKNRGYLVAVATNKNERQAAKMFEHFDFLQYFDAVCGADDNFALKKMDIIRNVLTKLGIAGKEAVMLGDSSYDALGAMEAGVDFVGLTYGFGFRTPEDLASYPYVGYAGSVEELIQIFA